MNINPDKLASTLGLVVRLLVERDFQRLEELTGGLRLTAAALRYAVDRYPFTLQHLPDGQSVEMVDRYLDVTAIENTSPQRWTVDLDLWDDSGERSDLTLQLEIIDGPGEIYEFAIDDLHVL